MTMNDHELFKYYIIEPTLKSHQMKNGSLKGCAATPLPLRGGVRGGVGNFM